MSINVYLCAPVAENPTTGSREENLLLLKKNYHIVAKCGTLGYKNFNEDVTDLERIPVTVQAIGSSKPVDDSMEARLALLGNCQEIWVFGLYLTDNMAKEIAFARENDIPVNFVTTPEYILEFDIFASKPLTPRLVSKETEEKPEKEKPEEEGPKCGSLRASIIEDICYAYEIAPVEKSKYINETLTEEAFVENYHNFKELYRKSCLHRGNYNCLKRYLSYDRKMDIFDVVTSELLRIKEIAYYETEECVNSLYYLVKVVFGHPDYKGITLQIPPKAMKEMQSVYDRLSNTKGRIQFNSSKLLDYIISVLDDVYGLNLEGKSP